MKPPRLPLISVILPTLNEKENLTTLIPKIDSILRKVLPNYEIIVVDDRSSDGTFEAAIKLCRTYPNVHPYQRKKPLDLGTAILYGIKKAQGKYVVGMDADGNHDPNVLPTLIKALKTYDLVVASRFVPGGGMQNQLRQISSWLFNQFLKICFDFPITDNTSGYYGLKRETLLQLKPNEIYYGYGDYHLRLVFKAKLAGLTIHEVPVYYPNRLYGTSKSRLLAMGISYYQVARSLHKQQSCQ